MKRLALFVLLLSAYAFGQGAAATATPAITNTRGEPVPYAQVAVCTANPGPAPATICNGSFATIYTDITIATSCTTNTTPLGPISGTGCTNPGKSDGLGNVIAFASPGQYWCEYYGGSITRPIVVPCFFAAGSGGGASISCSIAVNGSIGYFTAPASFTCDPTFITDGAGNWTAQSGRTLGPVNGMLGIIGGGTSPGTLPKYKLGANEFRWLGTTQVTPYYLCPPSTTGTAGQVLALNTQTTDGNGDTVDCLSWQNNGGSSLKTTYIPMDQCTAAQSSSQGNSFWSVVALTNWDAGHWEFVAPLNADIYCSVRIPHNVSGTPNASWVLDLSSADTTAGHTATFSTCDAITSGINLQVGALTCQTTQNYTSTTTAYSATEFLFGVKATIAADQILVVKIHQASGGTNTANVIMPPPKLKIDQLF